MTGQDRAIVVAISLCLVLALISFAMAAHALKSGQNQPNPYSPINHPKKSARYESIPGLRSRSLHVAPHDRRSQDAKALHVDGHKNSCHASPRRPCSRMRPMGVALVWCHGWSSSGVPV
jgi:hypothetical protein